MCVLTVRLTVSCMKFGTYQDYVVSNSHFPIYSCNLVEVLKSGTYNTEQLENYSIEI